MSEFLDVCTLYPHYQGSSIVTQDIMVYYAMQPNCTPQTLGKVLTCLAKQRNGKLYLHVLNSTLMMCQEDDNMLS